MSTLLKQESQYILIHMWPSTTKWDSLRGVSKFRLIIYNGEIHLTNKQTTNKQKKEKK